MNPLPKKKRNARQNRLEHLVILKADTNSADKDDYVKEGRGQLSGVHYAETWNNSDPVHHKSPNIKYTTKYISNPLSHSISPVSLSLSRLSQYLTPPFLIVLEKELF